MTAQQVYQVLKERAKKRYVHVQLLNQPLNNN